MTDIDGLLDEVAIRTNRSGRWTGDYKLTISDPDLAKELAAAVRGLRDRPCPHIETGDDGTAFCTLAEAANMAWADRWRQQHDRAESRTSAMSTHTPDEVLTEEAIRGFLLEKHLPFDQLDSWSDEIMAIVREHFVAVPVRSGGTDNPTSDRPACINHCCGENDPHPDCKAHGPPPTGGDDGR